MGKKTIVNTGRSVNEQIDTLSRLTKGAVKRIKSFRDTDKEKNTVKNNILLRFRNAAMRNWRNKVDED
jgi:hypothetical protein